MSQIFFFFSTSWARILKPIQEKNWSLKDLFWVICMQDNNSFCCCEMVAMFTETTGVKIKKLFVLGHCKWSWHFETIICVKRWKICQWVYFPQSDASSLKRCWCRFGDWRRQIWCNYRQQESMLDLASVMQHTKVTSAIDSIKLCGNLTQPQICHKICLRA